MIEAFKQKKYLQFALLLAVFICTVSGYFPFGQRTVAITTVIQGTSDHYQRCSPVYLVRLVVNRRMGSGY